MTRNFNFFKALLLSLLMRRNLCICSFISEFCVDVLNNSISFFQYSEDFAKLNTYLKDLKTVIQNKGALEESIKQSIMKLNTEESKVCMRNIHQFNSCITAELAHLQFNFCIISMLIQQIFGYFFGHQLRFSCKLSTVLTYLHVCVPLLCVKWFLRYDSSNLGGKGTFCKKLTT